MKKSVKIYIRMKYQPRGLDSKFTAPLAAVDVYGGRLTRGYHVLCPNLKTLKNKRKNKYVYTYVWTG